MGTKLDRATAALESGQRYQMGGEQFVFSTFADRSLAHPQDWDNLGGYAGALWPLEPSEDPRYLVEWNGGQVTGFDGWGTAYRSLDLIHETRHTERDYVVAWYACDGFACGLVHL